MPALVAHRRHGFLACAGKTNVAAKCARNRCQACPPEPPVLGVVNVATGVPCSSHTTTPLRAGLPLSTCLPAAPCLAQRLRPGEDGTSKQTRHTPHHQHPLTLRLEGGEGALAGRRLSITSWHYHHQLWRCAARPSVTALAHRNPETPTSRCIPSHCIPSPSIHPSFSFLLVYPDPMLSIINYPASLYSSPTPPFSPTVHGHSPPFGRSGCSFSSSPTQTHNPWPAGACPLTPSLALPCLASSRQARSLANQLVIFFSYCFVYSKSIPKIVRCSLALPAWGDRLPTGHGASGIPQQLVALRSTMGGACNCLRECEVPS